MRKNRYSMLDTRYSMSKNRCSILESGNYFFLFIQYPEARIEQPATSNQQPATSNQQPVSSIMNTTPKTYQLSQHEYERFQTLILQRTGILFGSRRRNALSRGVLKMAANCDHGDLKEYFYLLQQNSTQSLIWDDLIAELTVGETYFLRDKAQIDVLRHHIMPELISRHHHDRRLRIWSAGCATGEEPYSLAILLFELLPDIDNWNIYILGTDINTHVIHKAAQGRFREWSFRQTDPSLRMRYFRARGDEFILRPHLRRMVNFGYLNLREDCYPSLSTNTNAFDLILCRNVAIYHSEAVVRAVVQRFYGCLMPGGWLMVGAAETSIPVYGRFAARNFSGITVFQKVSTDFPEPGHPVYPRLIEPYPAGKVGPPQRPAIPPAVPEPDLPPFKMDSLVVPPPAEPSFAVRAPAPDTAEKLHQTGLEHLAGHRYEEALASFQSSIALNPDFMPALFQTARVHANMGRLLEARTGCRQVLEKDPLFVEAHYTLALIEQEAGDAAAAIDRLKKVLFLNPDFILGRFNLSILLSQNRQGTKADRHRRQAIRLASSIAPETVLPGSDDLTAGQMLTMAKAMK